MVVEELVIDYGPDDAAQGGTGNGKTSGEASVLGEM